MRIAPLTGLRGIAAIAVLLYHIPHSPAFAAFHLTLFSRAYLAVDLFFVLSGFVISIGYYERVVKRPSVASYGDFLLNRMARVWPLHFVVALVFLARILVNVSGDQPVALTPANIVTNLLMIQSWGWGTQALAGNSWSVSTELVAYLAYPLVALIAFSRLAWLQAAGAVALLMVVATLGHGAQGPLDVNDGDTILPVLRCLAGFSLGVIAYRLVKHPGIERLLGGEHGFIGSCVLIAVALLIPRGDVLVALTFVPLVIACYYNGHTARAVLANPVSFHLGLISYSIYLWHPLVRDVFARVMGIAHRHGVVGFDWAFVAALLVATWLICWASYLLIEVPGHRAIKKLERRFVPRPPLPFRQAAE
ncbi:acyltransferase [Sphingomonas sp. DG1-23]|uniref:acyltransferase family protein n=1 Tax=Sphingomonas sp. DG1-23 TaxID=3068316 RepID=UPI00273D892F|nr:acyltransferase [Sphingomonas sp. DG1-23]MDP5280576.1 acyltransferase [Sphingomonas sp. DG1-23]